MGNYHLSLRFLPVRCIFPVLVTAQDRADLSPSLQRCRPSNWRKDYSHLRYWSCLRRSRSWRNFLPCSNVPSRVRSQVHSWRSRRLLPMDDYYRSPHRGCEFSSFSSISVRSSLTELPHTIRSSSTEPRTSTTLPATKSPSVSSSSFVFRLILILNLS